MRSAGLPAERLEPLEPPPLIHRGRPCRGLHRLQLVLAVLLHGRDVVEDEPLVVLRH